MLEMAKAAMRKSLRGPLSDYIRAAQSGTSKDRENLRRVIAHRRGREAARYDSVLRLARIGGPARPLTPGVIVGPENHDIARYNELAQKKHELIESGRKNKQAIYPKPMRLRAAAPEARSAETPSATGSSGGGVKPEASRSRLGWKIPAAVAATVAAGALAALAYRRRERKKDEDEAEPDWLRRTGASK